MCSAHTVVDLFAGAGGMSQGFVGAGFKPVLAVENDLAAAATYAANHGESHTFFGDLATLHDDAIPEADVVIGGPPCQGFSNLGSRDVNDPRNKLWKEYLRVVLRARPKVFVLENVQRFFKSSEFAMMQAEAEGGLLKGYGLTPGILMAADYGVAQRRPRTIVIGSRVGRIDMPAPTHARMGALDSKPWRTVRNKIEGLPHHPATTELPERWFSAFGFRVPGKFQGLDLHLGRKPTEFSLARYKVIAPGQGRLDLPDHLLSPCWRNKPRGTTDVMGRMKWDEPSLTIRTEFFKPEKGRYLHPQWHKTEASRRVDRVITHLEAARLQDFPDTYRWCGTKTEIARQIGNAVPVGFARAIALQVRNFM